MPCHDDPDQLFHAVNAALNQAGATPLVGIYHSGAGSEGIAQVLHCHACVHEVVWLGHELSAMQHLLFVNKWLEHKPPSGPNEFRLFCAENLPSQSYLPAVPPSV